MWRYPSICNGTEGEGAYGCHVDDELPQRLLARTRIHIPERVVDRAESDVDDTLLRADPRYPKGTKTS